MTLVSKRLSVCNGCCHLPGLHLAKLALGNIFFCQDEEKEATGRQISAESMNDSRASQKDTMDYPERGAALQLVVFQAQTEQKMIKASNGCLEEMLFKKSLQPLEEFP